MISRFYKNIAKEIIFILILWVLGSVIFFSSLGKMPLWDTDEALYARIAKEMSINNNYLITLWNSKPWFCHPPLYFWLINASSKLFGWSEFSARFPSALFSLLLSIVIYFFGKLLFNKRAGLFAGIVFITMLQIIFHSRMATLDITFLFFIVLALYIFILADKSGNEVLLIGFWITCALSVMVKGPAGMIIVLFYAFIYILINKKGNMALKLFLSPGIILFFIISVPWFAGMTRLFGSHFTAQVFGYFFVKRFYMPVMSQGGPWYYYFPVVFAGTMPWTAFIAISAFEARKDKEVLFLLICSIATFIAFSIFKTKLPGYIIFIYPAAALMSGKFLDAHLKSKTHAKLARYAYITQAALLVFISPAAFFTAYRYYPQEAVAAGKNLAWFFIVLFTACAIIPAFSMKGKRKTAFSLMILANCIIFIILISLSPYIEQARPELSIINEINRSGKRAEFILIDKDFGARCSVLYYTGIPIRTYGTKDELISEIKKGIAKEESFHVIMKSGNINYIKENALFYSAGFKERGNLIILSFAPK